MVSHASVPMPKTRNLAHGVVSRLMGRYLTAEPKTQQAEASSVGIALEDWELLYGAVTQRLSLIAETLNVAASTEPEETDRLAVTRDSILECVEALNQLRTTLHDELDQAARP